MPSRYNLFMNLLWGDLFAIGLYGTFLGGLDFHGGENSGILPKLKGILVEFKSS